ncbi:MAG TPA: PEP-CTERM sorting domain-containing protein [Terriglobales bacterium]|nr:PEP-CTERM sorting domain-containing protein [Terriglobales bacterium]
MKAGALWRLLAAICLLLLLSLPAAAQVLYENGPINGQTDAWTINFGFVVPDTFTISGSSTITGLAFGAWLSAGDVLQSVEVSITSEPFGGTTYFDQQVNFTQSGCFVNNYGFDVCTETGSFNGPTLNNGTYWVNLENAISSMGDPVYWDENSGIGCHSPGCPSQAGGGIGSIPSETFSILGTSSGTGSVPEPGSLVLFAGGLLTSVGFFRRRMW